MHHVRLRFLESGRRLTPCNSVSIMICHNHSSGDLEPSEADLVATRRMVEVSKIIGIPVLDHIIVSEDGFTSIRDRYPAYFG